ncbi:MAG: transcriptional regulator NrdR [Actinomycetaceae bacterium]|nr:transcriptional regulator NrdR [Actinomycetaceae bacterium]MDY5853913.1 transcriptional regulator NrdR [Arcanobacterium sp.]
MHCPFCRYSDSRVVDTRTSDDGSVVRRRRECPNCKRRFTTLETAALVVVKRSGAMEPFNREKIIDGVRKASSGRPITPDQLALLAQQVEESIRGGGGSVITTDEVGKAILEPLRQLDEVAYLRFASVYSNFDSLDDFAQLISQLKTEKCEHDSRDRSTQGCAECEANRAAAA